VDTTGQVVAGLVPLEGYAANPDPDTVRLYADLRDLRQSVDVARDQIVFYEDLPTTVLPGGAVRVWVRLEATVTQKVPNHVTHSALGGQQTLQQGRLQITEPETPGELRTQNCIGGHPPNCIPGG